MIFIDIETIPGQHEGLLDEYRAAVKAPGNYSKPESIKAWLDENREAIAQAEWQKTALDGAVGQIVCISWASHIEGQTHFVTSTDLVDEKEMLYTFWSDMNDREDTIGGHNVASFDIPFLWARSIIHNVRPPAWFPRNPKPWYPEVYDTMHQWNPDKRISLDRLAKALGLPGKTGKGSDVWPMVQEGKWDDIAAYCMADVNLTLAVYDRMTFKGQ